MILDFGQNYTTRRSGTKKASRISLLSVSNLYQYLLDTPGNFLYPIADFFVPFVLIASKWLLYAFFLGYFPAYLRGNSGLAKGIRLSIALVIPFAVYRLLNAESIIKMRPFLLWSTQLFLYCSLIGLLAIDLQLLWENGYRLGDLQYFHNLPTL